MIFCRQFNLCAWCQQFLGLSDPLPVGQAGVSHGMCAVCLKRHVPVRENQREEETR